LVGGDFVEDAGGDEVFKGVAVSGAEVGADEEAQQLDSRVGLRWFGQGALQVGGGGFGRGAVQGAAGGGGKGVGDLGVVVGVGGQQVDGDAFGFGAVVEEESGGAAVGGGLVSAGHVCVDGGAYEWVDELQRPAGFEDAGRSERVGGGGGVGALQVGKPGGVGQRDVVAEHGHRAGEL